VAAAAIDLPFDGIDSALPRRKVKCDILLSFEIMTDSNTVCKTTRKPTTTLATTTLATATAAAAAAEPTPAPSAQAKPTPTPQAEPTPATQDEEVWLL
jgi:hypothetical protein